MGKLSLKEYSINDIRKIITEAVNWKQVLHSRYGDVNYNKTALLKSICSRDFEV